ncbi:histamine H2 receptor-like [Oculina patagonica]
MFSFPECITWLAVGLTESVPIVALNIITIIVFIKNRNLRKRSTYLVINLAVVDMLAGGFALHDVFYLLRASACNVLEYNLSEVRKFYILGILLVLFPVASLTNMTAMSIERLHATFWPFRHRVMSKWVYGLIIAAVWVTAGLLSIATTILREFTKKKYFYLWNSFNLICLLVICISYASIVIQVRCGAQPQHHGATSRERKLTMTLLIVTFVSLLLWLPYVVGSLIYFATNIFSSLSPLAIERVNHALIYSFYANSLVNPIVYATRIPEFRRALAALFRSQRLNQIADIPLRGMEYR